MINDKATCSLDYETMYKETKSKSYEMQLVNKDLSERNENQEKLIAQLQIENNSLLLKVQGLKGKIKAYEFVVNNLFK